MLSTVQNNAGPRREIPPPSWEMMHRNDPQKQDLSLFSLTATYEHQGGLAVRAVTAKKGSLWFSRYCYITSTVIPDNCLFWLGLSLRVTVQADLHMPHPKIRMSDQEWENPGSSSHSSPKLTWDRDHLLDEEPRKLPWSWIRLVISIAKYYLHWLAIVTQDFT